ncbi:MAG: hypothetical protein VW405_02075 [Rhodospirillaceae bacterium]
MKRRAVLIAILASALTVTASAQRLFYNGTISVTDSNSVVAFTDNGSGGTSQAFPARHVLIRSASASANTCFFDLKDTVASSADTPLAPGAGLSLEFDISSGDGDDGWEGMGAICSGGQTATFYVTASR